MTPGRLAAAVFLFWYATFACAAPALAGPVTMLLQPRPGLPQFLEDLQDPRSPEYHHWLTPEQFAGRFGRTEEEIQRLSAWLASRGLEVKEVGRGRNWLELGGAEALALLVRKGEPAGAPSDIRALIAGFTGPAAMRSALQAVPHTVARAVVRAAVQGAPHPNFTAADGAHYLAPEDIATIYGLGPAYNSGLDGTGIKIAIVGQSAVNLPDIAAFRSRFNLPVNVPQVIVAGADPGVKTGDQLEAHLDIEWAGAVAPQASILYVYSTNVLDAARYVVNQNLAQVLSMSYYGCETQEPVSSNAIAQQANAQGITWVASSGDSGAASCDGVVSATAAIATQGLTVGFPASYPEVTGVGGTAFSEGLGVFWRSGNSNNSGSAIGYLPEVAWNDTAAGMPLLASGGGASAHYAKPRWQNVSGVPADGARDVPDLALASSPNHDGYLVQSASQLRVVGGTSAAAPVFAGIVALLNQSLLNRGLLNQPGMGNINPDLYRTYINSPAAFHDVVSGNNLVPCQGGTPDCSKGVLGFSAAAGYDQVTGLGSVDAGKLIFQWNAPAPVASAVVLSVSPDVAYQQPPDSFGSQWFVTLKLTETAGGATTITGFTVNGRTMALASFFPAVAIGPLEVVSTVVAFSSVSPLPATATFVVTGKDASGRAWSQQASVQLAGPRPAGAPAIGGVVNGASFKPAFAPGMAMSVFGVNLANGQQAASSVPLPKTLQGVTASVNGVAAPLYYASPGQVNLQLPYATQPGNATVTLTINGQSANFPITVQANAPGVFSTLGTAKRGDTIALFLTGDGQVTPALPTGSAPAPGTALANLPKPVAALKVSVGGLDCVVVFKGIPVSLVGTTQVNFQVPGNAPLGAQPVVVSVAGVNSPAVILTVAP